MMLFHLPSFAMDQSSMRMRLSYAEKANISIHNSLYSKFSSPELEFLRHIRNAVSHGNQFFFKSYDDGDSSTLLWMTIPETLGGGREWISCGLESVAWNNPVGGSR
jgi:hypothetical protein